MQEQEDQVKASSQQHKKKTVIKQSQYFGLKSETLSGVLIFTSSMHFKM